MPIAGTLSHFVIDCHDPEALSAFWADLLGVEVHFRWHQYVMLRPTVEGGPALTFQQVDEPKVGKSRAHLDIAVDDLEAAIAYAVERGATRLQRNEEDGVVLEILADPEGNEFCLVKVPT
jgi:predicted enzyme related to lactoylglutathione lyase